MGLAFNSLSAGDAAIVRYTSRAHSRLHNVQCPTGQVSSLLVQETVYIRTACAEFTGQMSCCCEEQCSSSA